MLSWLTENLGSLIIGLVLLAIVAAIVAGRVRKCKMSSGGCSCGCSGCPMSGSCHGGGTGCDGKR